MRARRPGRGHNIALVASRPPLSPARADRARARVQELFGQSFTFTAWSRRAQAVSPFPLHSHAVRSQDRRKRPSEEPAAVDAAAASCGAASAGSLEDNWRHMIFRSLTRQAVAVAACLLALAAAPCCAAANTLTVTPPADSEPYVLQHPDGLDKRGVWTSSCRTHIVAQMLYAEESPGVFLEWGEGRGGEAESVTLALEKRHGWTGVVVEEDDIPYKVLSSLNRRAYAVQPGPGSTVKQVLDALRVHRLELVVVHAASEEHAARLFADAKDLGMGTVTVIMVAFAFDIDDSRPAMQALDAHMADAGFDRGNTSFLRDRIYTSGMISGLARGVTNEPWAVMCSRTIGTTRPVAGRDERAWLFARGVPEVDRAVRGMRTNRDLLEQLRKVVEVQVGSAETRGLAAGSSAVEGVPVGEESMGKLEKSPIAFRPKSLDGLTAMRSTNPEHPLFACYIKAQCKAVQEHPAKLALDALLGRDVRFIQLGAHDGVMVDPLSAAVRKAPSWRGVLVEPMFKMYFNLLNNYKEDLHRLRLLNVAVTPDAKQKTLDLHFVDPESLRTRTITDDVEWVTGLSSAELALPLSGFTHAVRTIPVPAVPLREVFAESGLGRLDVLQLDIERLDCPVLWSFREELKQLLPAIINFEIRIDLPACCELVEMLTELRNAQGERIYQCYLNFAGFGGDLTMIKVARG
ncbi:unnamed protein product [Pedinophyceae sp. YPF-701]|nr:unnamed protein product [Pedinophyceae sp. YPF-701]